MIAYNSYSHEKVNGRFVWAKHPDKNIVFTYTFFGSLWMLVFAQLLPLWIKDSTLLALLQPAKDWGFLLISSGLLYVLLRRSRQSLQQAEQKYRCLFENALKGIYQVTPDGQYISANPALARIYGYKSPKELIAKLTWQQLDAHTAHGAEFMRLLQESDAASGFELHVERPDGSSIWTCESARAVRDTSGKLLYYEGTVEDITSRQRIEQARAKNEQLEIRVQERTAELMELNQQLHKEIAERQQAENTLKRYQLLAKHARDIILFVNPDGQIIEANQAAVEAYGYSRQELLGLNIKQLRAASTDSAIAEEMAQAVNDCLLLETTDRRKDGSTFPVEVSWQSTVISDQRVFLSIIRNITKRKQAESERLQLVEREQVARAESEAARSAALAAQDQIANILESITDAFFALDNEWRFTYLNRQAERFLQRNREDLLGKNVWEEFPEAVGYKFYPEYHKAVSQQVSVAFEELHLQLNTWFEVHAYPSKDGLSVYFNDINDRKRAEAALRESEERFRQLAENINQVFWMTTPDMSQTLYVSPAYEKIWGKSCQTLYEQPSSWQEVLHPEDRESAIATAETQNRTEIDHEYRIVRPDGSIRWIRDRAFPVRDDAGQVYRVVGIAEDITSRKRAEDEVQFLQGMNKAVFESQDFDAALFVALQKVCEATGWDFGEAWIPRPDGTVLECSSAWYSRVDSLEEFRRDSEGFTFTPGTGIPGRVWLSKQPEWRRDVSAESGQIYVRAQMAHKAGLKAALGIPIVNNDSVLAVLVFYMFETREEDQRLIELISASTELGLFMQRKKADAEIRKALEKEKELGTLKSRFVSMTSHEFRTPLATISLSAGLLETYGYKWTQEKKQTHWQRINTAVERMTQMLDDVLLIGKAEAGKLEFNPAPLDLQAFCGEIIAEMQLAAGVGHTLTFVTHGQYSEASTGTLPLLDEKLLRHILTNLLSNAIKYSPSGGNVQFELIWHNREVIFRIQDQGIGIPLEDQKRLFETFHRATNVGSISGTGLGLAIVKKFVELHGGEITLQSQVGAGTTFTVKLPLQNG